MFEVLCQIPEPTIAMVRNAAKKGAKVILVVLPQNAWSFHGFVKLKRIWLRSS